MSLLLATALGGCTSHVKGSWACALEKGTPCESIAEIDHATSARGHAAKTSPDPVIEGAIPARLWGEGGWPAGEPGGAPIRDPDQIVKVAVAPWVDAEGDYHAGAEVYAVMRRGGWYVAPRETVRRVELSAASPTVPVAAPAQSQTNPPVAGAQASRGDHGR